MHEQWSIVAHLCSTSTNGFLTPLDIMQLHLLSIIKYVVKLVGLLIHSSFSREKLNELTDQQDMFCFNHASTFYMRKILRKMLINNKFETQIVTGTPTGNSRCHALASPALNISCSFGQSARSIKSRYVVISSASFLLRYWLYYLKE